MAETFKANVAADLTTSGNTIYTASGVVGVVIGLSIANKSTSAISANAFLVRSSTRYTIAANSNIIPGSSLVLAGSDQKIVLQASDSILLTASANGVSDGILSVLEIS